MPSKRFDDGGVHSPPSPETPANPQRYSGRDPLVPPRCHESVGQSRSTRKLSNGSQTESEATIPTTTLSNACWTKPSPKTSAGLEDWETYLYSGTVPLQCSEIVRTQGVRGRKELDISSNPFRQYKATDHTESRGCRSLVFGRGASGSCQCKHYETVRPRTGAKYSNQSEMSGRCGRGLA